VAVVDGRYPFSPYCGAPPTIGALSTRWNLDPALLAVLTACLVAWAVFYAMPQRLPVKRQGAFLVGWALGAMALISPLCALSVSLLSARVGQHMFLTTLVAPMIAFGLPPARSRMARNPLVAALAFTLAFWFWHAPGPYTATFIAGLQMALLGAVITFLPRPVYAPHLLTTLAWGLTPLQDQQLGGVIMWVPAGALFAGAMLAPLALILRSGEPAIGKATVS
jgi:putative membrane protein